MKNSVVRLASIEDANIMAIIYSKSWLEAYSSFISVNDIIKETEANRRKIIFEKIIQSQGFTTFVIQKKELIIGFMIFKRCNENNSSIELLAIYLLPKYWGQGFGSYALEFAKNYFINSNNGVSKIELWVFDQNNKAKLFYQKNGFLSDEIYQPVRVGGKEYNSIKYSIDLIDNTDKQDAKV